MDQRQDSSGDSGEALNAYRDRTVTDFGEQWTYFQDNEGYYASDAFFDDLIAPLLTRSDFRGASCAEIGAGTGNICAMVLRAGARHVIALEPSAAVGPLRKNLSSFESRAEIIHARGEELPARGLDLVLSIGVLHHIPNPKPVVRAAFNALRPGGRIFIWLYGKEGNAAYLAFVLPVRSITRRLPVPVLHGLAYLLDAVLMPLTSLARRGVPVPMAVYLKDVYGRLAGHDRRVVIVDQLKPAWAKYYTEAEARTLLADAGFEEVKLHNRHGYSWSVVGMRPQS